MGFQSESNFTSELESAKNFAWISAFGDTVKARLAASALGQWWAMWGFDPTKNYLDQAYSTPFTPRTIAVGFPYISQSTTVHYSGRSSLRLAPRSTSGYYSGGDGIRIITQQFRIQEGRSYTFKVTFRQDTGVAGTISAQFHTYTADKQTIIYTSPLYTMTPSGVAAWTTFSKVEAITAGGSGLTNSRWATVSLVYEGSTNPVYIDEILVFEAVASDEAGATCAFSAYQANAQNTGLGTYVQIQYSNEVFDQGANFATGASAAFTAPYAGIYHFSASAGPSSGLTTEQYAIGLFVNSVQSSTGNIARPGSAGDTTSIVSATLKLAAGDVVSARLFSPTVRAITTGLTFNWFSGHCVSRL